ncbi:helix-turn-helix domain-containing protein [Desulfofundulus thermocisternus]|uniref:helix-turn-helix domain-containing protein n=1 Tax=Desulfofundulus thermocisternus TaxID=42471 RepID=UPI00217F1A50|nr:helix-turn-helix transcriptional regulator [Desulfofundulus thermocisternus]MCS5696072.1 helix-turn-helix transcriptional regulator [Desulfofundulus thermocisternus]
MFNRQTFAIRLKQLRKQNNVSMQKLAEALNLKSKAAISQFENCVNLPSLDTLVALADFFDVSIDFLLGRTDNPKSHQL